ncbi:hypothetical protein ACIQNU_28295 [Streptomyces sp. NPDC091292]|uniref:hypothetical protein n=1 Tax=Streptomyces sp. NPDC091292 TaxID=3365991 RepID=UPI003819446D
MDAGLAAVLGATVGATGTALAAVATGWWARSQAKLQASTQLQQTRLQLRSDQLYQQRGPRVDAYDAFLGGSYTVLDKIHNAIIDSRGMGRVEADQFIRSLKGEVDGLQPLWSRVAILGPHRVASAGLVLLHGIAEAGRIATAYVHAVVDESDAREQIKDDLSQRYFATAETVSDFIEAARPVLDLDPTSAADLMSQMADVQSLSGRRSFRRNGNIPSGSRSPE